jgi:hypothetical protein
MVLAAIAEFVVLDRQQQEAILIEPLEADVQPHEK